MFIEPTDTTFEILIDNEIMNTQRPGFLAFFCLYGRLTGKQRERAGKMQQRAADGT